MKKEKKEEGKENEEQVIVDLPLKRDVGDFAYFLDRFGDPITSFFITNIGIRSEFAIGCMERVHPPRTSASSRQLQSFLWV